MSLQADRLRVDLEKHGLGRVEAAIMDMDDLGFTFAEIASTLGKSLTNVRDTVYRYRVDPAQERREQESAAQGSRALLRAQLQAGQHYLPSALAQQLGRKLGLAA